MNELARIPQYPSLGKVIDGILEIWPEHLSFLSKSFATHSDEAITQIERVAGLVMRLIGDQPKECFQHYRWMCQRFGEEELHFRRTGKYRLDSFSEAESQVYANKDFMRRYMNGLLVSQLLWPNHAGSMISYLSEFLPGNAENYRHLEVGPGHGLALYFAASDKNCGSVCGWDISRTSIDQTLQSLEALGVEGPIELQQKDIQSATAASETFNSIVISEVLEHLERPDAALTSLFSALAPGGRIFINMPVNSPAPDHIFLLERPEDVVAMVERAGFKTLQVRNFPAAGYTEEDARVKRLTISTVVMACRPEGK